MQRSLTARLVEAPTTGCVSRPFQQSGGALLRRRWQWCLLRCWGIQASVSGESAQEQELGPVEGGRRTQVEGRSRLNWRRRQKWRRVDAWPGGCGQMGRDACARTVFRALPRLPG
eukprot:6197327-Pleurochrysis_carterae.AAC.1